MARRKPRILDELESIEARRRDLLAVLSREDPLAVGSVSRVWRRCGSKGCHCQTDRGHEHVQFLYTEGKHRHCKLIRRADEEWMEEAGARYVEFRELLSELRSLNQDEIQVLYEHRDRRKVVYKRKD